MLYHKFNREVMFGDKLLYYLANYTLQHSFEKEVIKFLKKVNILSTSLFRGLKGGDYLFINKKYL